jgi:riboflavin kinase/FMN adenylyltransferase
MKIFRNFDDATIIRTPVVTTGSFDGVHVGHKTILNRLRLLAEKNNGESVLITFHPHPRRVLYPETTGKELKLINSQEEKLTLLRNAGLDNVIIIEFTKDFARTTSEQFVEEYLCNILKVKVVVVGFNHHFGFNKTGDYNQLREMGSVYNFMVEEIPEQEVQNETVSSTRIRQAIQEGYIQRANAYLDHYYLISGTPVPYSSGFLPESIPFFKIPVTEDTKLLPAAGIYAVSSGGSSETSKGMAIISDNSSGESEVLFHPFLMGKNASFQKTTLFFHKKISGTFAGKLKLSDSVLHSAISEISDLIY